MQLCGSLAALGAGPGWTSASPVLVAAHVHDPTRTAPQARAVGSRDPIYGAALRNGSPSLNGPGGQDRCPPDLIDDHELARLAIAAEMTLADVTDLASNGRLSSDGLRLLIALGSGTNNP